MLALFIRTNQRSSNNVFNFLHILFLLHICTALLTIVNALNNNDNEAIIQLSADSIHVVKSSDPRFANIEENANDDEEKELLIALLTSFDDDYKTTKQIHIEKSPEDEISLPTNCTSSPTAATTAGSSSSNIRFIPSLLDFNEQSIAIPRMKTVMIINDDSEPLELHSLSGTTVQFYSSFFTQKTLSPNGGNTTINVYYLPRTLGITKSTFTIKTNRGTLHYYVNGIGIINPFHIRPLIGATIPLNATFEYLIHFYNPYNYSIDINEIYTSDENLIIELLSYKNPKTKIIKTFEHKDQWHIKPYQNKPIIKINYLAYKLDRLHGFYCIKTNTNDTIVVPVEITVLNHLNIYSNVDILEFSPDGLIRSTAKPISIPVYVINNGINPVTITDVRVTVANMNYATIHHERVQVPAGINHLTKIAELTLNPGSIPSDVKRIRGSVQVFTASSSINNDEPVLQIPFRASILHGSLDYEKETTYFYIPPLSIDSIQEKKQECQSIKLINRFNTSLVIYNITTDKTPLLSQYVEMKFSSQFVYANSGQSIYPLCITLIKRAASTAPFLNLEASLTLHTNLSYFHFPIHLYSGLLAFNLVTDGTNGGIKRNDSNPFEYFIASIPVNEIRIVKFIIINANPIDITIEKISLTLPKTTIQLVQMQSLNGTETKVGFKNLNRISEINDFIFPARQQAVFALTINGANDPSFYHEKLIFKTRYENLNINLKYRIISGSLELENKLPIHMDVFPDRLGTADIFLHNNFDEPTDVARIEFPTYGKCFSFIWNNTSPGKLIIDANATYQIGKLRFDMIPLCTGIQNPSESTCYCGLNNHPEFKQRWEQHVSALNTYELDHILVVKFRNLWKEWTSLVRKQRLHTNIWLETDQANMSWPVTIGFVWPSVLEHMSSGVSRTPVILDFYLTLINTTKTQNVIITNPSSSPIQYSIELISNYENKKFKKKGNSINNNQVFDIAKPSKRVELVDGIYKFSLSPNEQITFTASYRPKLSIKQEIYLVVRNNLTIIESILLRGEGGSSSLTVGNRNAGSSDIPLVLEMNEKQYKLCSNYLSTDGTYGNPLLQKVVTLRNTGNMKVVINDISFGYSKCSGQGFSVNVCSDIEIEPNDRYDLRIRFQPDYTLAEIAETLTLNTNIGLMTFPLIVRIPQKVLATCYQTIPRPGWEIRIYWLCLCTAGIMLLYIIAIAIYDARRLYNDYLARAELRNRIPTVNSQLVDLTDLTAAVQDEQKNRERIESRISTNTINNKKETSKDENKNKENDIKAKRGSTSANGNKDSGDATSKTLRTRDGSDTPIRTVATSPKAVSNKTRRSTTDNGLTKPCKQQQQQQSETPPKQHEISTKQQNEIPTKQQQQQQSETPPKQQQHETPIKQQPETPPKQQQQQHETSTKPQTVRTQKTANIEQSIVVTPSSTTPSSTVSSITVTDEENEPFVVARSKRVSGKTKDTTVNVVPVKVTTVVDNVVPLQPTPSPPASVPSPPPVSPPQTAIPKFSTRSDLSEQRQNQQDLSRSSDSINDQQWQKVSSNRGIRKATTSNTTRRESTDESQINKTTSNNSENPVVSSSSRTYTSVSNQVTQSRRRRARRPTRTTSPTHVSSLNKRQSLQNKTSLSILNRELAFRQLTEQLWAAGLPSSTTACSMSVRSRCSSAPPSERGGGGNDDMIKFGWNNNYYNEDENIIGWDEPDKPDDDFGRYVSQTEQPIDESNTSNEWAQQVPPPLLPTTTVNEIPSLMSIPTAPVSTNIQPKIPIPPSIITEEVEPLPFPQHGPGPIQRPNKLTNVQIQPLYLTNSIQSPGTPDVLDQLNRLLDHQNSIASTIVTPTPMINNSSGPINDLTSPNIPWSTYTPPTEWSTKFDSPWPLTNIQTPTSSLTTPVQNPFTLIPTTINDQQRQPTREEASVWSSLLGTATPRLTSSSTRTQRASTWNELFSSTVPSATESIKPTNNSWLKYWSAPDPSSVDGTSPNGHDTEIINPFWSLNTLSNGPIVPSPISNQQQQTTTPAWWPNAASDVNNNENQTNHLNDDTTNNRDQSRWDFAR